MKGIFMKEKLKKTGNIEQLAYIRNVIYQEGSAQGLEAWQIRNKELFFSVAKDKGMDISELSYRGINISFLARQIVWFLVESMRRNKGRFLTWKQVGKKSFSLSWK